MNYRALPSMDCAQIPQVTNEACNVFFLHVFACDFEVLEIPVSVIGHAKSIYFQAVMLNFDFAISHSN